MIKAAVPVPAATPLKPLNSSNEQRQTYLQLPYQTDTLKSEQRRGRESGAAHIPADQYRNEIEGISLSTTPSSTAARIGA